MRINAISAINFLKLGDFAVDMDVGTNVHLFCGHNEVGKTSLQEALRFALAGETPRVRLKSEHKLMVRDGAKDGSVIVDTDIGRFQRTIAKGEDQSVLSEELHWMAPNLLDSTRVAWIDQKARRKLLSELMQITVNREDIKFRLEHRGLDAQVIEYVMPMLRNGFEASVTECKTKATMLKGEWRAQSLEDWGSKKAETWRAEPREIDLAELTTSQGRMNDLSTEIASMEAKLDFARGPYGAGHSFECPSCQSRLQISNGQVTVVQATASEGDNKEFIGLSVELAKLDTERQELQEKIGGFEALALFNTNQDETTKKALEIHTRIKAWLAMAAALAPDGIPAEIIAAALDPVNKHLQQTALMTGWEQVKITPTMDVTIGGRIYGLCSESSQWRAQVEITEALSAMSAKFFVVDRMDVLDQENRMTFLKWISQIAVNHDTIILIATLKEPPKLPPTFAVHWMENGEIPRTKAAA